MADAVSSTDTQGGTTAGVSAGNRGIDAAAIRGCSVHDPSFGGNRFAGSALQKPRGDRAGRDRSGGRGMADAVSSTDTQGGTTAGVSAGHRGFDAAA
jgi:hypothetical protein